MFFLDIFKKGLDQKEAVTLLADISANWELIGIALGVLQNDLKGLQQENIDKKVKLSRVIAKWMETESTPVSWETLISAIEGPIVENKKKAKEIRDHLNSQH